MREKERQSAVTVEYLITTIVVLGVGVCLLGFQGDVASVVDSTSQQFSALESKLTDCDSGAGVGATPSQELLQKESLDDYSWAELKIVADDLSANGEDSVYYAKMTGLMQSGSTKTFDTEDTSGLVGSKMRVRIIGLCQDQKSDGTGVAGLTFQTTHMLATCLRFGDSAGNTSDGGWKVTEVRAELNGDVFDSLPSDLRENIVSVDKWYNSNCSVTVTDYVTSVSDKLFLLSAREMYNYSQPNYHKWYVLEGTGVGHDEQYAYYSFKRVYKDTPAVEDSFYLTFDGEFPADSAGSTPMTLLRSTNNYGEMSGNNTYCDWCGPLSYKHGVAPAFCF